MIHAMLIMTTTINAVVSAALRRRRRRRPRRMCVNFFDKHFHGLHILFLFAVHINFASCEKVVKLEEAASYFGDSYQFLPSSRAANRLTPDVSSTVTKFELWFKTAQLNGLLVKAVSSSGTFAIRLRNGRLETEFHLYPHRKIEFLSPQSIELLNDLNWHHYSVARRGDEFSFSIDDRWLTFKTSQPIGKTPFQLTDQGIYIAGVGGPGSIPSGDQYYRGCLADVQFNDVNLHKILDFDTNSVSFRVQRNCTPLFSPMADGFSLSFNEEGSFVGFETSKNGHKTELSALHFEIRTQIRDGPLLYSALNDAQNYFLRLDIKETTLYMSVSNGKGTWRAHSQLTISDGSWHRVGIRFHSETLELTVDRESEKLLSGSSITPEIGEFLYFGAIVHADAVRRTHDVKLGAIFVGCLHNIVFNYEHLITRKIVISNAVSLKCALFGSCSDHSSSLSKDSMQICANIEESQREGYVNDYLVPRRTGEPLLQPLFVSNSLFVQEGNSTRLELGTLRVFPQHHMFGLTNRNIVFQIIEKPRHGKLTLMQNGSHDTLRQFSFQDVLDGKVNYTHDGSETSDDLIEIELQFLNLSNDAPASLRERYVYSLPIKVVPFNDPPRLHVLPGATLRLAQDSRMQISQDDIMVYDPDNLPTDVKIRVVTTSSSNDASCGHFEYKHRLGSSISEFSLDDLKNGFINFKHHGTSLKCDMTLVAKDLVSESSSVKLRVSAFQLQLRQYKNSGVQVLPYGETLITNSNLSFVTNAPNQAVEIRYQIVKNPKYGYVEIKDRDNHDEWWVKNSFTQMQLDENRVRYRDKRKDQNELAENVDGGDSFKFQVSALNSTNLNMYALNISYVPVIVKVYSPNLFIMNNTLKKILTRDYLFSWILNVDTHPSDMYYRILRAPLYGFLYKIIDESKERYRKLGVHSNFTQQDINTEKIFYQLRYAHYSILSDDFLFKVRAPNVESERFRLDITYLPGLDGLKLINQTLVISEGSLQLITNTSLQLSTKESTDFIYVVDRPPLHGELIHLLPNGDSVILKLNANFTSEDINLGRLFYRHDGTETSSDKMHFIARPSKLSTEFSGQRIPFYFSVKILLENDNPPVRVMSETSSSQLSSVFQVVQNGDRLLSKRDLRYVDADVDFDNKNLKYLFDERIVDGSFVYVDAPTTRLGQFTQGDIENDRVMFRHTGYANYFRLPFHVTDGKHDVPGELLINASLPFLRITKNTGLKVDKGKIVSITGENFTTETNLNVKMKEIIFRIKQQPKYGVLMLIPPQMKEARGTDSFDMQDVYDRRLLYVLSGEKMSAMKQDWIVFTAHAQHLELDAKIRVEISDDDGDGDKLKVVNLKELVVSDRGVAVITQDVLYVQHPKYSSSHIVYIVTQTPKYGSLILEQSVITSETITNEDISRPNLAANQFTQRDVDVGNVQYLHNLPSSVDTLDEVQLSLSINNVLYGDLTLKIRIVNSFIILEVTNITVMNGRSVPLTRRNIQAKTSMMSSSTRFDTSQFMFSIVKPPEFGFIENADDPSGQSIASFTAKNLKDGVVHYTHRGDTQFHDKFTIVVSLTAEETIESPIPQTIYVTIHRPNIKKPELIRNEALALWNKKMAEITADHLYVYDFDTPDEEIQYIITDSRHGNVTFVDDPTKSIHNFSQSDVNASRVLFVHSGVDHSSNRPLSSIDYVILTQDLDHGGFSFVVTDGKHQLDLQWFTVKAPELGVILKSNTRIVVSPESSTIISNKHLLATMQDAESNSIVFSILEPPKFGQILVSNQPSTSFTQRDVDNEKVSYNQSRSINAWLVRDVFSFRITILGVGSETLFLDPEEYKFRIIITYAAISGEKLNRLVPTSTVRVQHGGSSVINAEHINITQLTSLTGSALQLDIVRIPEEGYLRLGDENVTEAGSFSMLAEHLNDNAFVYHHDKSKFSPTMKEDFIIFEIFPEVDASKHKRASRLRIPLAIEILPSKGHFYLRRAPKVITIPKSGKYLITADELMTEDHNTGPSGIFYQLTQAPTNGMISIVDDLRKPVISFTQFDVDQGRVYLIHDGSIQGEGWFTFKVSDQENVPISHTVKILLEPMPLSFPNFSNVIFYKQGASEVVLTNSHLGAKTNGPRTQIRYNITVIPKNGTLFSTQLRRTTDFFNQYDIDLGRILYVPTNLESYKDEIQFTVQFEGHEMKKSVTIRPYPAVEQTREVIIGAGGSFVLNEKMIRLSPDLKDKSPRFVIVQFPTSGNLTKEGGKLKEPARSFTYNDILAERILYVNKRQEVHNVFSDFFTYELRADGVQSARGKFQISIQPGVGLSPIIEPVASTPLTLTRPPNVSPLPTLTPLKLIRDHNIVIFVMVPVMFLALLVVVIRRVRISNERQRRLQKEKSELEQQLSRSSTMPRPDVVGSTLIGMSPTNTNATDVSCFEERTASIRSGKHSGSLRSNGTNTVKDAPLSLTRSMSLEKSSKGTQMQGQTSSPYHPLHGQEGSSSRLITFDPGRTEIVSTIPMCKVTPLAPKAASTCSSSSGDDFRYAYQYSSSASDPEYKMDRMSLDRTASYRQHRKTPKSPIRQMKLKENQYWV